MPINVVFILSYPAGGKMTEVTANYTSTESDFTDASQVTSATALTELKGTAVSFVFVMTSARGFKDASDFRLVFLHYSEIHYICFL